MGRYVWGAQAVALGAWEVGAAFRAWPAVSEAYKGARRRWRRRAELALGLWLMGLGLHLLRP